MGFAANIRHDLTLGLRKPPAYPKAAVKLAEIQRGINIHLHALSGSCKQSINTETNDKQHLSSRSLSSRRHWSDLAWQDTNQVYLPKKILRFADKTLNRDLYFWLAAYLAFDDSNPTESQFPPGLSHLLQGVATSERVFRHCPGLRSKYQRLCRACLCERNSINALVQQQPGQAFSLLETGFRYALGDPKVPNSTWLLDAITAARHGEILNEIPDIFGSMAIPFWPVVLWRHPLPPGANAEQLPDFVDSDLHETATDAEHTTNAKADHHDQDYSEEPPELEGDRLIEQLLYPEWNYRRNEYRVDWCQVQEMVPDALDSKKPDSDLTHLTNRVRRQFEALRNQDRWRRRLPDGEDIDIKAFVDALSERRGCGITSDRIYRHRIRNDRDMSVAVLLDVSNSTMGHVSGPYRVIDIAQQAMFVLAEALNELQDDFGLYAFSSYSRKYVECLRIKGFFETYSDTVKQRILSLTPRGSTRIGAALRHVGKILGQRPARHRLLFLLTDGRPYDPSDKYQGRYALEDTRRAAIDLRNAGVLTFALTIDRQGQDYLPYLFGPNRFLVFSDVSNLPEFLPRLYARLTGLDN